jgi:hypothetical protein
MTPPAAAPSRAPTRTSPGSRQTGARRPRRVSGPAGPAPTAGAVAIAAPGIALPRQRPAFTRRRAPAPRKAAHTVHQAPGVALRTLGALQAISTSAALDRLIRGRLWIGLLAFSLIGIVAMQLVVLKLNTGIGSTLEREATLQRENAQLGIEDSMYSAESRVGPLAAAAGMTLAPAGTVHFVQVVPADVSRAASVLSAPIQASVSPPSGSTETGASPVGSNEVAAGTSETSGASTSSQTSSASGSSQASGTESNEAGGATGSGQASGSEAQGASAPATEEASSSSSSAGG